MLLYTGNGTGWWLGYASTGSGACENFFFAGINKVRFWKPVVAGDTMVMKMTLIKLQKRFGVAKMDGKAYIGGQVLCDGELFYG